MSSLYVRYEAKAAGPLTPHVGHPGDWESFPKADMNHPMFYRKGRIADGPCRMRTTSTHSPLKPIFGTWLPFCVAIGNVALRRYRPFVNGLSAFLMGRPAMLRKTPFRIRSWEGHTSDGEWACQLCAPLP